MTQQKITDKLNELNKTLIGLKDLSRSNGADKFEACRDILNRIIDRTYPEKDAKELKSKLIHKNWAIHTGTIENEEYWQKFYIDKIDLSLRVINTILQEYELFGFDDFKPIKETVETESTLKTGIFGFKRKKTREK